MIRYQREKHFDDTFRRKNFENEYCVLRSFTCGRATKTKFVGYKYNIKSHDTVQSIIEIVVKISFPKVLICLLALPSSTAGISILIVVASQAVTVIQPKRNEIAQIDFSSNAAWESAVSAYHCPVLYRRTLWAAEPRKLVIDHQQSRRRPATWVVSRTARVQFLYTR